jgi:glycosyltransferase involved in cell wall biosynthesis
MAKIDIAIPNYNYGRYLHTCIDSIYRQGLDDVRILILDNASTDDSVVIAQGLAARDSRIELCLRPKNLGQHASFNAAVDWAQSEYFVILCSDDYLPDGALKRAVDALDRCSDANLVFGRTLYLEDGAPFPSDDGPGSEPHERYWSGGDFLRAFCETGRNLVNGPMAVVRTAAQKQVGHFRVDLPHTDDMEMWMRFAVLGGIIEINRVQSIVRIHGANQSAVLSNVHHWNMASEAAFEAFFSNFGRGVPDAGQLLGLARRSLSDRAYWCAVSHLVRGDPGVLDLAKYAIRLRPSSAVFPPLGYAWRKAGLAKRVSGFLSGKQRRHAPQSVS